MVEKAKSNLTLANIESPPLTSVVKVLPLSINSIVPIALLLYQTSHRLIGLQISDNDFRIISIFAPNRYGFGSKWLCQMVPISRINDCLSLVSLCVLFCATTRQSIGPFPWIPPCASSKLAYVRPRERWCWQQSFHILHTFRFSTRTSRWSASSAGRAVPTEPTDRCVFLPVNRNIHPAGLSYQCIHHQAYHHHSPNSFR